MSAEEFDFNRIGTLTAAIPAMLGFVPSRSLVFLILEEEMDTAHATIKAVARLDLDAFERSRPGIAGAQLARLGPVAMVAIIDDQATGPDDRSEHQQLLRTVTAELRSAGMQLTRAWVTPAIVADSPWWALRGGQSGTVSDPATEAFTASAIAKGVNIGRSRADVEARFAPDPVRRDQVTEHLRAAVAETAAQLTAAVSADEFDMFITRQLTEIMTVIEHYDPSAGATPAEAAYVAARFADREILYDLFRLCGGKHADQAESLWQDLTRCLTGPARAIAAILYGFSAYVLRGDGASALIAVDLAIEEDPESRMARLLRFALEQGVSPEIIRERFAVSQPS